jgi:hypothetical protein
MQIRELVLMGGMGALQPELWRWHQRQEARVPIQYFNPVMHMQVRELVLVGGMGALQPEQWQRH